MATARLWRVIRRSTTRRRRRMKNVMYVQIMGHEYPVEANPGDELYVNRLAQFVEEKMREMKQDSKIVDSYKLAVMAAMNITDELFRLQEAKGSTTKTFENKSDEWIRILDHALQT